MKEMEKNGFQELDGKELKEIQGGGKIVIIEVNGKLIAVEY